MDVSAEDRLDEDDRRQGSVSVSSDAGRADLALASSTSTAQIKAHSALPNPPSHSYTILLVPRATELCRKVLEEEGVLGDVTLTEYNLAFIPLEPDVLSLEMDHASKEIFAVSLPRTF